MSYLKITSAAAVLMALAMATQAHAAPRHYGSSHAHVNNNASTFDNTYRDPTTREALDEGLW